MTKIPEYVIERIKESARIEEVVNDFVSLKKKGVRYLGLCPFHEDRHLGNFVVYPKKNIYYCFACEAKGDAVKFLMEYNKWTFMEAIAYLGRKYNLYTDDMETINIQLTQARPIPDPLPMLTLPTSFVTMREDLHDDNFIKWLCSQNWGPSQTHRLPEVISDYHVGHSKNGMTIWWQIDEQQRVRTGKMMRYGLDGHRDKSQGYNFDWIHSALFKDPRHPEYDEDKQEMKQCLFGLHLLDHYTKPNIQQTVCLVESEKTAVIMATAYGNHANQVWMATGGLENLTREKLRPIINANRNIVCYPDRDGIEKWKVKVEQLHYGRCTINTEPVTKWWRPEDGEKADIADVVIRMINNNTPKYNNIDEVMAAIPIVKRLHQSMNLTIEEQ